VEEVRDVELRGDGIRVATPLRTLFGLARRFNQHRFERAAEDAWHRGLVSPDDAADYLAAVRRSGKEGVRRMEHWLERTSHRVRPSQSRLESRFVQLIEQVGLPTPVRQLPLTLDSGETIHLDIAWPDVRLAVEPGHSWWHGGDLRQRADQARDRACALVGWHVLRYDEAAARDRAATARELLALHRRRVADLGGGSVWKKPHERNSPRRRANPTLVTALRRNADAKRG
jgi:very-short-patch-repair endonuclease